MNLHPSRALVFSSVRFRCKERSSRLENENKKKVGALTNLGLFEKKLKSNRQGLQPRITLISSLVSHHWNYSSLSGTE